MAAPAAHPATQARVDQMARVGTAVSAYGHACRLEARREAPREYVDRKRDELRAAVNRLVELAQEEGGS